MTSLSRPAPYGGDGTVPRLDPAVLEDALGHADLRALLMVAFHLSGDRRWLSAPFLPRRDVRLIADENAGHGHWGLQGMRERAQRLGAELQLWTRPGLGTEIALAVPARRLYHRLPSRWRWPWSTPKHD